MAAGDLITQDWQVELWRGSDSNRLLMGRGTDYGWMNMQGFGVPAVRDHDQDLQSSDGAIAGLDTLSKRSITQELLVTGSSAANLDSKLQALGAMFQPQYEGEADAILTFQFPGARRARCVGRPRRADWPQDKGLFVKSVRAGWEFIAHDPLVYSTSETAQFVDLVAGQSSVATTVVNIGDRRTKPILEILGPAINPRIANNNDANKQIKIDITLSSVETLIVDVKNKTVTLAGVDRYGTVRTDNQWFYLVPGNNLLTFSRTGTTGAARMTVSLETLGFRYRLRWASRWATTN